VRKVLNVGGNSRDIALPAVYQGWKQVLLDIDPRGKPDIVCDARQLSQRPASEYDAVYCSHNLEHYYRHDGVKVLGGFQHVLKQDGFVHLRVPDIGGLMRVVVRENLDIDDFLYQSPAGPITVRDVLYGFGVEIERSGEDFYAHKTGFTRKSLIALLRRSGFSHVFASSRNLEIVAFAFKARPTEFAAALLKLPTDAAGK
jgi:hypothetical protein